MEVIIWVATIVVIILLIGNYMVRKRENLYRKGLSTAMESMDAYNYKDSQIYKNRVDVIEENGLAAALMNVITENRIVLMEYTSIHAATFFLRPLVKDAEAIFLIKYAVAHGYGDEFQELSKYGKFIDDMVNSTHK